jgi:hypothetical protein
MRHPAKILMPINAFFRGCSIHPPDEGCIQASLMAPADACWRGGAARITTRTETWREDKQLFWRQLWEADRSVTPQRLC